MPENNGVDVVLGIDINAAHKLDELSRFSPVVAAGFVQSLADQMKGHSNCPVLEVRLS